MEDIVKNEFQFYCKLAKPLVLNLPKSKDRILAAAWIKKFMDVNVGTELLRTTYLKLLLFCLQRRKLTGIFSDDPADYDILEVLPAGLDLNELARNLLDQEKTEIRERIRQEMMGDMAVFPAYTTDCSPDLTEYVAAQDIPNFGVHCFYAISNQPVNKWQMSDKAILPKGVKSAIETTATAGLAGQDASCVCGPKSASSAPDVEGSPEDGAVADCRKKKDGESPEKKKRKPKKLGRSPPTHPIGEVKHIEEERMAPTWGTNLLDVREYTDVGKVDEPTEEEVQLEEQVSRMMEEQEDEDEDEDEDKGEEDIASKASDMRHIIDEFRHGKMDKSKGKKAPPDRLKNLGDKSRIKPPKSTKAPKIAVKGMKKKGGKGKGGKGGYGPKPPNLPEEFADWNEKDLEEAGLTWADLMPLDDNIDDELQRIEDEGMVSDVDDGMDALPDEYEGLTDYDAMIREAEADLEAHKTTYDVGVEEDEPIIELFDDEIEELEDELNLSRAAEEMQTTSPALASGIPVTTPRRSATPRRSRAPERAFAEEEDVLLKQRISPLRAPKELPIIRKKDSIEILQLPEREGHKDQNMSEVFKEARDAFNEVAESSETPAGAAGPSRRRTGQTAGAYNSDYEDSPAKPRPGPQRFPKAKKIKKKGRHRSSEPEQEEFERLEREFADECLPCSPRQQAMPLGSPSPGAAQRVRQRAQQQEDLLRTPPGGHRQQSPGQDEFERLEREFADECLPCSTRQQAMPLGSPSPGAALRVRQRAQQQEELLMTSPDPDYEQFSRQYGDAMDDLMGEEPCPPCDSPPPMTEDEEFEFMEAMYASPQSTQIYSPTSGVELPVPNYNYGPADLESPGRLERERQDVVNRAMEQELSLRHGSPLAQEIIGEAEADLIQDMRNQSLLQESPPPGLASSPPQLSPRQQSPPRQSPPPGEQMASPPFRCRGAQMLMQESPPAAYGSPPPLSPRAPPMPFPEGMENPWGGGRQSPRSPGQDEFERLEREFAEECLPCSPRQQAMPLGSPSPGAAQRVRQRAEQQEARLRTPPGGHRIFQESPPAAYRSPPQLSPRGPPMPFPGGPNPWEGRRIVEESPPRGFDEVCEPCEGPAPGTGQYFPPGFDFGTDSPPLALDDRPKLKDADYKRRRRLLNSYPNLNVGSKRRDKLLRRRRFRPSKCPSIQDDPFREQYEAERDQFAYQEQKLPARGLSPWRNEPRPGTPPRQLPEERPAGYRSPFVPGMSSPRTPPCQRPEMRPDDFQSPFNFGYIQDYQQEERYDPLDDTLPPEEVGWDEDRLMGVGISEAELEESREARRFKYPEGFVPMDQLPADEDYWTEDMLAGGLADVGELEDVLPPDSPCTPCEERERPVHSGGTRRKYRDEGSPRQRSPRKQRPRQLFPAGEEAPCDPYPQEGPEVITIKPPQRGQGYTPPGVAGPSRRRTGQTPPGYNSDFEDTPPRPSPGPQRFPQQRKIKKRGRRSTPERQSPCGTCDEDVQEEPGYGDAFQEVLYANLQVSPSKYPPPRSLQRPPPAVCPPNLEERYSTRAHLERHQATVRAAQEGNLTEHFAQRDMQDLADQADLIFNTERGLFDESPPREVFEGNYYPEIQDASDALMKSLMDYDLPESPSPPPCARPAPTAPPISALPPPGARTAAPCARKAGPPSRIAGPPSRLAPPGSRIGAPPSRMAPPGSRIAGPPSRLAPPGSRIGAPPSRMAPPGSRIAAPPSRMAPPGSRIAAPPSRIAAPPSRMAPPGSRIAAPPSRMAPPGSRMAAPPSRQGGARPPGICAPNVKIGPCGNVCDSGVSEKPSRRGIPQPKQLRETKSSQLRKGQKKPDSQLSPVSRRMQQKREKAAKDAEEKKRRAAANRQAAEEAKRAESMARVGERLPGGRIRPPDYAHAGGTGEAPELSARKAPAGTYDLGHLQQRRLFPPPQDYPAGGTGQVVDRSAQKRTDMRYAPSDLPRKNLFGASKIGRAVCQPCDDIDELPPALPQSPGFAGELRQHTIDFPGRREHVVCGRRNRRIRRRSDTAIDLMGEIAEEERSPARSPVRTPVRAPATAPCIPCDEVGEDEDEYRAALREMGVSEEEAARIFNLGELEDDEGEEEAGDYDEEGMMEPEDEELNAEMSAFDREQDEFWRSMSEGLTDEDLREIGMTRPSKTPCGTCDSGAGPSTRAPKKLTQKDQEMLAQLQRIEEQANRLNPGLTEYERAEQAVIQREQEEREYYERMMREQQDEGQGRQGSGCKGRRSCGRDY